ncbi:hypothetical protein PMAYCL1PPCAC_14009, partial [Pristionchus mayeri]
GSNSLPNCHADGTLKVDKKELQEVRCDPSTGQYKYTFKNGGGEKTVDKTTKFHCDYPEIVDTEQDEKNAETIKTGGIIAGGLAGALVLGAILGCGICLKISLAKDARERKKAEIAAQKDFIKYVADDQERKADKLKKKNQISERMSAREKPRDAWNDMIVDSLVSISSRATSPKYTKIHKKPAPAMKEGLNSAFMAKVRADAEDFNAISEARDSNHELIHASNIDKKRVEQAANDDKRANKFKTDAVYRKTKKETPKRG